MQKVTFTNNNPSFSITLRKRIEDYFKSNNYKLTGNSSLYIKSTILIGLIVSLYALLVFVDLSAWISIPLCMLMGFTFAAIGFNLMHDGAHGSYSEKKWVNETMAYSLNLLGGSSFLWKLKHNGNHHNFTNINGLDDDIDVQPWIRFNYDQTYKWFHKYQHIYWPLLYGLAYISWVFFMDFKKYFTNKIAGVTFKKMSLKEHVIFWVSKLTYIGVFMVIPATQVGIANTMIGYTIMGIVCGFTLSIIFQLAHVVEDSSFPHPQEGTNKIENDWTIHQLSSTANFSTRSGFLSWFAGGLNYQVEHHLFPRISHIHYPKINKIVKEVCDEFNIRYMEYPSIGSAIKSHIKYLKLVGSSKLPA